MGSWGWIVKIASLHLRLALKNCRAPDVRRVADAVAERFRVWARYTVDDAAIGVTELPAPAGQESEITIRVFASSPAGDPLEPVSADIEHVLQPALDEALAALALRRRARQLSGRTAALARWRRS